MIKKIKASIRESKIRKGLIHKHLKTHHPRSVKNAKSFFKFKYPKLFILALAIIFAYLVSESSYFTTLVSTLGNWSYVGVFIAGLLFSFGFTAPFAIAFFVILSPDNFLLSVLIGGAGAMIADLIIFKTVRFSMMDEIEDIENGIVFKKIRKIIKHNLNLKIFYYLLFLFAGLVIASPLPDEIGVSMLAGFSSINEKSLMALSFVFNTLGIFILLLI